MRPGEVACATAELRLEIERPAEIIVRNRHSLISAGTELACLGGEEWWFKLPGTPGYAAVGEIVECGPAVSKVAPGDVVLTHGPHAEYFRIDTLDRYSGTCVKLPHGFDPRMAPVARMASISFAALRVTRVELGDYVLVAGLGLIGNLAAQLVACQGGVVIGIDVCDRRRALAEACGVAHTFNSATEDWKTRVRDVAGRRGVTTFIDATGLANVVADGSTVLAPHGETVLLGTPRARWDGNLTDVLRGIHLPPYATFHGALEWRFPTFADEFTKHSVERNTEIILELAAARKLDFDRLISHRLPPERAPEAYAALAGKKDEYLGVILDWTGHLVTGTAERAA